MPIARTRASSTAGSCWGSSTRWAARGSSRAPCATPAPRRAGTRAVGSIGGSDPESVVESDLIVSWGADLLTTNLHLWPLVEQARARGAKLVVIEPRRSGTAARADWHLRVNVGTDAALALGVMHVLARDGPLRPRLPRARDAGLRSARARGAAALHPRARGRDHRRLRGGPRAARRGCTAARGRPSSGWARGCRARCRAARPSARWRSCPAWWAPMPSAAAVPSS